ncbi:MAG: WecB/TagA/CpsF family glycosyltransferase [Candidatus Hydrogenedentes bacterium]|nr:WecB/TagA/CpsF family glycosyltransferase [Candidatus Hydrogenedentota bacterium]
MMLETVQLFGMTFDNITFEEVRHRIAERIESGAPGYVVTPNVDHVCRYHRDEAFRNAYQEAFLVLADGMPIMWASRLLRKPICAKLSGSDLVPLLSEFAAQRGYSVFYFGAAAGVAAEAADRLCQKYAGLKVAGVYSPPMHFEKDPEARAEASRRIREASPDICFVALGSPKQEYWLHQHARETTARVCLGIGAGLDFAAGRVRRAPVWVQNVGLEWAYRLAREPRRLWHRYLVEDMLFFGLVWREWRAARRARPGNPNG